MNVANAGRLWLPGVGLTSARAAPAGELRKERKLLPPAAIP